MRVFILPPELEPAEPEAPIWMGDSRRAVSQPDLPPQDMYLSLFAKSQTFTERQDERTDYIRNNYPDTAFGEMMLERTQDYGGRTIAAGSVTRSRRKR